MDVEEEEQGQDTRKKRRGGTIIVTQSRREYRGKLRSTKNKSHPLRHKNKYRAANTQ